MNGHRNIRPSGYREVSSERVLVSITPRHIDLLKRIESPLVHILEIFKRGTGDTGENIAKFQEQYFAVDIRPSILIFVTPENDLKILEALGEEEIREAAQEMIFENENPSQCALLWQILAMNLGAAMERFKNCQTTNN